MVGSPCPLESARPSAAVQARRREPVEGQFFTFQGQQPCHVQSTCAARSARGARRVLCTGSCGPVVIRGGTEYEVSRHRERPQRVLGRCVPFSYARFTRRLAAPYQHKSGLAQTHPSLPANQSRAASGSTSLNATYYVRGRYLAGLSRLLRISNYHVGGSRSVNDHGAATAAAVLRKAMRARLDTAYTTYVRTYVALDRGITA